MISQIIGKIEEISEKYVLLTPSSNGLSYKIFVPRMSLKNLKTGETAKFFTRVYIRETSQELYGFLNKDELNLFEQLLTVSGVGPNNALNILSGASIESLITAIIKGDSKILNQIPGIGRKTAEKIIIELKEKLIKTGIKLDTNLLSDSDARDALVALGYSDSQARNALSQVSEKIITLEERIKEALKNLSRK